MKDFLASITRHWLSLLGNALALASLVLIVSLFVIDLIGDAGGPYLGILTYLILPAIFVLGLILIPIGSLLYRQKRRRTPECEDTPALPVFDLNNPRTRNWMLVLTGATMLNIVVLAGATYKGVHTMETNEFCGLACHSVMQPEYTAYQHSPHANVPCVECHVGPGADAFVESKLNGAWQLVSVAFDLYPRPIPTPIHNLPEAEVICGQCHWAKKFIGEKLAVRTHYADDEQNTELNPALLLKVGGEQGDTAHGIHWHNAPDVEIRYRSDEKREEIYEVELTKNGETKHYVNRRAPEEGGEWRTMDCIDCHNRPSHRYSTPAEEIDLALRDGLIDRSLPYIRREGERLLDVQYASHEEARTAIASGLRTFYAENYPGVADGQADLIGSAADKLGDIYAVNVFPHMNVWWDTYVDHSGHQTSDGCFRCHNRKLRTAERDTISSNCSVCHTIIADGEESLDIANIMTTQGDVRD